MEFLNEEASGETGKKRTKAGLYFTAVIGGVAVAISVVCLPFVSPGLRRICLPYVPATTAQVGNVLRALEGRSGSLIDLGSGDGRIVISTAKQGFKSAGVELNVWLVLYSRLSSMYHGLQKDTLFFKKDLWKFSLKPYNNVVIFGVQEMMQQLEEKMIDELEAGSCIVACRFPLPTKKPLRVIGKGIDTVWVYRT